MSESEKVEERKKTVVHGFWGACWVLRLVWFGGVLLIFVAGISALR